MDFYKLADVKVDSTNQQLISDLDSQKAVIDSVRPLPIEVVARIGNEIRGDQVYSSNAIEGNQLSLRETRAILESGEIAGVGRRRDSLEALNLGKAVTILQNSSDESWKRSDESLFLEVHRVLLSEVDNDAAGRFRNERVTLLGAKHQPPRDVSPLLNRFFDELRLEPSVHPLVLAAWAHWSIARIHPFMDGNGRMARLWQDFILLSHHYTPAVIPLSQRKSYYSAMQEADEGDFTMLIQLTVQSALATSQLYVSAIREADEAASWAASLVSSTETLAREKLRLEYSRWKDRVLELREAFRRCITLLNRNATEMEFAMYDYEMIDQATWQSLRSEPYASQTWCFRIVARRDGQRVQYVFFAGKHFSNDQFTQGSPTGPQVCLLVSEKVGQSDSVILQRDNHVLTLREILMVNNQFSRIRWDAQQEKGIFDHPVTALKIAQDFLQEVVEHRLLA